MITRYCVFCEGQKLEFENEEQVLTCPGCKNLYNPDIAGKRIGVKLLMPLPEKEN